MLKNVLKCMWLKNVDFQYYVVKFKKSSFVDQIQINNIHRFNLLRFNLEIFSKKIKSSSDIL
jgi:hypothetical protein